MYGKVQILLRMDHTRLAPCVLPTQMGIVARIPLSLLIVISLRPGANVHLRHCGLYSTYGVWTCSGCITCCELCALPNRLGVFFSSFSSIIFSVISHRSTAPLMASLSELPRASSVTLQVSRRRPGQGSAPRCQSNLLRAGSERPRFGGSKDAFRVTFDGYS